MKYEIFPANCSLVVNLQQTVRDIQNIAKSNYLSVVAVVDEHDNYVGCIDINKLSSSTPENDSAEKYVDKTFKTVSNLDEKISLPHSFIPVLKNNKLEKILIRLSDSELEKFAMNVSKIAIIGMGYVGATLGVALSEVGFNVVGIEKNDEIIKSIKNGKLHFFEPNGDERLQNMISNGRFRITDPKEKIDADAFIITVGTPLISKEKKKPNDKSLNEAIKYVEKNANGGELVILRSTVPVGTCEKILGKYSHLFNRSSLKSRLYLAMAPERTIEGKALEELFSNPQLIGTSSSIAVSKAKKIFSALDIDVRILSGFKEAELSKLVDNTSRDFWFSYANLLSLLADEWKIDVNSVISEVNSNYSRTNVARPSPGVGGPCLSKDTYLFLDSVDKKNKEIFNLLNSARKINELSLKVFVETFCEQVAQKDGKHVHVLGMAFKGEPETNDLRDSTSLEALNYIERWGMSYYLFDPVVEYEELKKYGMPILKNQIGEDADGIIILNNHKSFDRFNWKNIAAKMGSSILFDGWGIISEMNQYHFEIYKRLGSYK